MVSWTCRQKQKSKLRRSNQSSSLPISLDIVRVTFAWPYRRDLRASVILVTNAVRYPTAIGSSLLGTAAVVSRHCKPDLPHHSALLSSVSRHDCTSNTLPRRLVNRSEIMCAGQCSCRLVTGPPGVGSCSEAVCTRGTHSQAGMLQVLTPSNLHLHVPAAAQIACWSQPTAAHIDLCASSCVRVSCAVAA